jgi:hypothetical protein
VTLSREDWTGPDVPSTVTVGVRSLVGDGTGGVSRSLVLHRLQRKTLVLPAPARPFRVEVHVQPTYSPAQFGFGDTRQLGAQISFSLTRR